MGSSSELFGGGSIAFFDPAKAYALGDTVRSAVDMKLYIRRANAGVVVATNPQADYTNWLQDGFPTSTKSLQIPNTQGGPTNAAQGPAVLQGCIGKGGGVFNGYTWANAANVYGTILSLTGRGMIDFLALAVVGGGGGNPFQYKVTVDDVVIHDTLQGTAYSGYYNDHLIGGCQYSAGNDGTQFPIGINTNEMFFARNFKVEARNPATAANQITLSVGWRFKLMA